MAPPTALVQYPVDRKDVNHHLDSSPIPCTLPPAFNVNNFPIIDLNDSSAQKAIASACHDGGYFLVVNHGINPSTIVSLLHCLRQFFNLPLEDKMKYASDDPTAPVRYGSSLNSTNPSQPNLFQYRDYLRHIGSPATRHLWPSDPSTYAHLAADFLDATRALAVRLASAINEDAVVVFGEDQEMVQVVAGNYYPPCIQPDLATLGVGAHKDPAAITMVVDNGVDGLQVRSKGGEWVAVPRVDGAVAVMMGEGAEVVSDGRVKAAEHRVVVNNASSARISVAIGNDPKLMWGLLGFDSAVARENSLLAT